MEIIKGVEFPKKARTPKPYPFEQMEVGDMLFIPNQKTFTAATEANKNDDGRVFAVRRHTRDGVAGVGVWRTQ